ncbi:hypothetical protein CPB86DRAFT_830576 [Serendipita vermifera]|nr:hypothetical protein CPB86DRAFT_830576 [Serendipita vermifera]
MVELLTTDLIRADPLIYREFIDYEGEWRFRAVKNPYIRLLGFAVAGMDQELDQPDMAYLTVPKWLRKPISNYLLKLSPFAANPPTIDRLRLRFWNQLDPGPTMQFIEQALLDLDTIDQTFIDLATYKNVISPNKDCLKYLFELCNDIKKSPKRLSHLLTRIARFELQSLYEADIGSALNCRDIIAVVQEYYLGEDGSTFNAQLYELADILRRHLDELVLQWDILQERYQIMMDRLGSKEDFTTKCTQVIHGLTSHKFVTFGLHTSRTLACARPLLLPDVTTGWLGMYDGKMFRPEATSPSYMQAVYDRY